MSERIEQLLRQVIGLDVDSVGRASIDGAVRQRLAANGCADEAAYWAILRASPEERQALVDEAIVPETWFFRYPRSFRLLLRLAQERLSAAGRHGPLRLLSLPCATGEEPYSIAMTLLDGGLPPHRFAIEAIDVSQDAISRAIAGLYRQNAFREAQPSLRPRHFSEEAGGARVAPEVRDKVRFRIGNLIDPLLPASEPAFDFVFCRNLLIYFDRETQARAVRHLRRLLQADGILFTGPAEATLFSRHGLTPLDHPGSFAFRRSLPPPQDAARPAIVPRSRPVPAAETMPFAGTGGSSRAEAEDEKTGRATSLATIAALADSGRQEEARLLCEQSLARHGPAADLYYWLGLLHDARQDTAAAEAFYRKALYLEPQHAAAGAQMAAHRAARAAGLNPGAVPPRSGR